MSTDGARVRGCVAAAALLALFVPPSDAEAQRPLVYEHGPRGNMSTRGGIFTLRGGRGWVRTRSSYDDFVLSFEYRLEDVKTRAGIAVRSWPVELGWPERGYEIPLAGERAGTVVGRVESVRLLKAGTTPDVGPVTWHAATITTAGPQVNVTIDGIDLGTFAIGDFPGAILFFVHEGRADFRNIVVHKSPDPPKSPFARPEKAEVESGRVTLPRVVREVKPRYSESAMDRKAQGGIEIEMEVLPDGSTGAMHLVSGTDEDLDLIALAAARQWRFEPAKRDGQPIGMLVTIYLSFVLK